MHVNVYPLGDGYRGGYQLLAALFGIECIGGLSIEYQVVSGFGLLFAVAVLMKNHKLEQRLSPPGSAEGNPAPKKVKSKIRTWSSGQLAWVSLSIGIVEWLLYQFILQGNAPLIARQLLGVLLLIVIPTTAIGIGWTWFGGRRHRTYSRTPSDIAGRIRRMTTGQFWLVTAVFALTCLPFIQRSRTGYDRLVNQQDELTRTLMRGPISAQLLFQMADENRQALGREREIGYACDTIVILIGVLWVCVAWVWFGSASAIRAPA